MENEPIKLRLVFMGTSELAEDALKMLIEKKYNIVGVYTKPDKKTGRSQQLTPSPVKKLATENSIKVFTPAKFDTTATTELKTLEPDLIVVAAYGKILPKEVLTLPGLGCINIHPSLLPKFRGPSPIQNALLCGEKETGVTIMFMDEGIDTGDILIQEKINIDSRDTYPVLYEKLSKLGAQLLDKTINLLIEGKLDPQPQDNAEATMCQLIDREDGHIFWEEEAQTIYNKYRALTPWPGIFTFWKNDNFFLRIKLLDVSIQNIDPQQKRSAGEIFQLADKIGVQTSKGVIIINKVQLEGKKPALIEEFINGYPQFVGSILQ